MKPTYRVISPYKKDFITIYFNIKKEAIKYVQKNSAYNLPFDERYLTWEVVYK